MCQAMDWTLSNQMAGLIPVNKVGTVTVGGMFRLIDLTCRQCAFVPSLDAQTVGIVLSEGHDASHKDDT